MAKKSNIVVGGLLLIFFGIGFLAGLVWQKHQYDQYIETYYGVPETFIYDYELITLTDTKLIDNEFFIGVEGNIENNGDYPLKNVRLNAGFYHNNDVVNSCATVLKEILNPGEIRQFKIECHDMQSSVSKIGLTYDISNSGFLVKPSPP